MTNLAVTSFDTTDHLLFTAYTEQEERLDDEQCRRLLNLEATSISAFEMENGTAGFLAERHAENRKNLLLELKDKDTTYFKTETLKLQKWADDRIHAAEKAIRDTKLKIRELERQVCEESNMDALLDLQKKSSELKKKQRRQRSEIFEVEDEIEGQRDEMIKEIEGRMQRKITEDLLFSVQWQLV